MSEETNYETFRECVSSSIIQALAQNPGKAQKTRHSRSKRKAQRSENNKSSADDVKSPFMTGNDAEELADFIEYIASEIFVSLPAELRTISFFAVRKDESLAQRYSTPLPLSTLSSLISCVPLSVSDTLTSYSIQPPDACLADFLNPIFQLYTTSCTALPPPPSSTRASACEICARDYIPLTYHHLIPRGVHAKVLKRGWHEEWELNHVAWLCRACHSFVHRIASNEELAKEWFTVEKILAREDVVAWAGWVGRVRWKAR